MHLAHIAIFAGSLITAYLGIAIFRRWMLNRGMFDVPNERSSHSVPTPRGGGLVIVVVCMLGYIFAAYLTGVHFSWGYFAGAILIATVSWLDDLYSIAFGWRLLVHISAAVLLLLDLGYLHRIGVPFSVSVLEFGSLGIIITLIWIVWLVNAYNFMDGIDGIAGTQAVIAGIGWILIAILFDYPGIYLYCGILTAACIGFLIHNWQPARIFMGDVGSSFLGFTFASLPLLASSENAGNIEILTAPAFVFVWFFIFDTALTFILRVLKGEKVWQAHRDHLYQKMVISGMNHSTVSLIYGAAAVILAVKFVLAAAYGGNFRYIALFSGAVLTFLIFFLSRRKLRY